jgi:hypothetical protein
VEVMSIHSATLPLRTFDLRQVCYEGALERCSLGVGRLRPDIVKVAEQPPSVTYIDDDGRKRRHVFDFRFTTTEGKRLLAAVKPSALIAVSGIDRIVDTATGTNGWPLTSWSLIGPIGPLVPKTEKAARNGWLSLGGFGAGPDLPSVYHTSRGWRWGFTR